MKKILISTLIFWYALMGVTFAQSSEHQEASKAALQGIVQKIEEFKNKNPQEIEKMIGQFDQLQAFYQEELKKSIQWGDAAAMDKVINAGELINLVKQQLADILGEKTKKTVKNKEHTYHFFSRATLPWVNIFWWNDSYYAFPSQKNYVQLQWASDIDGDLYNTIKANIEKESYKAKYFYAGKNTLQDLAFKDDTMRIGKNDGKENKMYLYFDLPIEKEEDMKNISFSIGEEKINTTDIYNKEVLPPLYALHDLSKGYHFCKKVAEWKGTEMVTKEYKEEDCNKAVLGKIDRELHPDILEYLANLAGIEIDLED